MGPRDYDFLCSSASKSYRSVHRSFCPILNLCPPQLFVGLGVWRWCRPHQPKVSCDCVADALCGLSAALLRALVRDLPSRTVCAPSVSSRHLDDLVQHWWRVLIVHLGLPADGNH